MILFRAAPIWITDLRDAQVVSVPLIDDVMLSKVLLGVEYRGQTAHQKVLETVLDRLAIFAKPPNDLPALLRTADQLLFVARQTDGEKNHVQYCACGTRYSFPINQQKNVLVRCHNCNRPMDVDLTKSPSVDAADPDRAQINGMRTALSAFFRDAMACSLTIYAHRT